MDPCVFYQTFLLPLVFDLNVEEQKQGLLIIQEELRNKQSLEGKQIHVTYLTANNRRLQPTGAWTCIHTHIYINWKKIG